MLPAKQSEFGPVGQLIKRQCWYLNDRRPRCKLVIAKSAHHFGCVLKKMILAKGDENLEVSQCPYTSSDGIQYMLTSASSSSLSLDS